MQQASDVIAAYVARGRATFDADPAVADALLYQFVILGEAAKTARRRPPPRLMDRPPATAA